MDRICEKCGNSDQSKFTWRGKLVSGARRFRCGKCGEWGHVKSISEEFSSSFTIGSDTAELQFTSNRVLSEEEIIEVYHIDEKKWSIDKIRYGNHKAYRKDKKSDWEVSDGKATGSVHDTGKLLVVPLFTTQVTLRRKTQEIRNQLVVDDLKADLKKFAPKYKKIKYPKLKDGVLLELCIFDFHFGRLCWGKESGSDFDVIIAAKALKQTMRELLAYAQNLNISKILIPFGGDYFNVNNKNNTTVHGTAQQEDTRYAKTFKLGRQLAVDVIDECSQIAPVDVLLVKGNHDEEKLFYLGDALESWFHNSPNVNVDNSPKSRKYYLHGKVLLGFTHGNEPKLEKLPMLMALEVPDLWEKSTYREFHTGDKHHRFTTIEDGVVIRIVSPIASPDQWTYDKGFIGSLRATESFVFHPNDGLIGQFTAKVRE